MRAILAWPRAYRIFGNLVGGPHARAILVRDHLKPEPGQRVLDLGCGTGELADNLVGFDYVGVEPHEPYVRRARALHPSAQFECTRIEDYTTQPGAFDLAVACGVLHHLDDDTALTLLRAARASLKPNGRLITLDGCFMPEQRAVVRWLLSMDRGRYVRTPEHYRRLAQSVFPSVQPSLRQDLLRIPYTHLILSCTRD